MHKLLSRIYHRLAAWFASDIRNVDARFTAIAAAFDERFLAIEKEFERSLIALRTSQQKSIAALEAELHSTFVEHGKCHVAAERQLNAATTALDARITALERGQREAIETLEAHEATAIYAVLDKHTAAIRHLDFSKREAPGVKGGRPELLN
jgi:hypothetical protein